MPVTIVLPMPDIIPPPCAGAGTGVGAALGGGRGAAAYGLAGPLLKKPPPPPDGELLPPELDLPPPLGIFFN